MVLLAVVGCVVFIVIKMKPLHKRLHVTISSLRGFFAEITLATYDGQAWADSRFAPSMQLPLHPATHVLHYASKYFEGMKAFHSASGYIFSFSFTRSFTSEWSGLP